MHSYYFEGGRNMRSKHSTRLLAVLLALVMVLSVLPTMAFAAGEKSDDIVVLYTNDVHCGVDAGTPEGTMGYANLAAYKKAMEQTHENVVLVDAGDAIQGEAMGTLSNGSYLVDIMNEIGYDFATFGNHEFDYGMDVTLSLLEKSNATYLSCNFMDLKTGKTVAEPYALETYGDLKVAFVGISTPESFTKSTPTYFQDAEGNYIYSFSQGNEGADLYAAVQKAVDAAVADGADYVVALGHLGNEGSTDVWTSKSVIANTTGIDVFIDGHSHETYDETVQNKDGEDVVLAQTGTKLANIGKVVIDTKTGDITAELVSGYEKQDETVAAYVAGVNEEFAGVLQEVVAKSDVALTTLDPATGERAVRNAETNLGDLCADAYRVLLGADIAFVNGGGIRADIAAGDITYEDIINVHPFGNEACLVETTGQDILDALEMGARLYPEENGGFLQVSGISYTIDASVPSSVVLSDEGEFVKVDGDYRVKDVMVGDEPLDVTKTYTLASHNYMLKSGGDGFVMFKDDTVLKDCVMIDNQVLINYIVDELGGVVSADYAEPQGRITIVNADSAAETPEEPAEPEAPADWADVAADAWYADAVASVTELGLMNGTSETTFSPAMDTSRGMLVTILARCAGVDTTVSDVWYADGQAWAVENGVSDGTNMEGVLTREQLVTMLWRYAGSPAAEGDLTAWSDGASVSDWATDAVTWAVENGLLTGSDTGALNPQGNASRAELATLMVRASALLTADAE